MRRATPSDGQMIVAHWLQMQLQEVASRIRLKHIASLQGPVDPANAS